MLVMPLVESRLIYLLLYTQVLPDFNLVYFLSRFSSTVIEMGVILKKRSTELSIQ
jgi:hypothetical protein